MKKRHSYFTRVRNYYRKINPILGKRCSFDRGRFLSAKSIVIIKNDKIGDFILSTTFLNTAYDQWRDREVTLVCSPVVEELASKLYPRWKLLVVRNNTDDQYRGSGDRSSALQAWVHSWPKFDLLVNLRGIRFQYELIFDSWVAAWNKVAISNQSRHIEADYLNISDRRVYSKIVKIKDGPGPGACGEIHNYRTLLATFFSLVKVDNAWPDLRGIEGDQLSAFDKNSRQLEGSESNTLILCPFPSASIKRYPYDRFAAVVSEISRKYSLGIRILGGKEDEADAVLLASLIRSPGPVEVLAGKLRLLESLALIRNARLFLGVDTGLSHMAVSCGVPSIVILGGGHYGAFGPWGEDTRSKWLTNIVPCFNCNWQCIQPEPVCILGVAPAAILRAADELLTSTPTANEL